MTVMRQRRATTMGAAARAVVLLLCASSASARHPSPGRALEPGAHYLSAFSSPAPRPFFAYAIGALARIRSA
ncbi:MAG: hypothetical protein MZW92_40415 [Comamonadaceae bacterium]|nr:hypothetical protein [Comamonadaceae bacterium]